VIDLSDYLILLVVIALIIWALRVSRHDDQDEGLTIDKSADLIFKEKPLYAESPWRVSGRPDRIYRLPNRLHFPLEFKTRDHYRIYETDVAQLSLQAWLLRENGYPTVSYGYLVIKNRKTHNKKTIKVSLQNTTYCNQLMQRHLDLIEHRQTPRKSYGLKCEKCGHKPLCRPV
jgi:CRISPR/Cas system-associated exonuclease Cas4 (RecB family)